MHKRSRLLCPCGRAEFILDRMSNRFHGVPFDSLFDEIGLSPPLLREMQHGKMARGLGASADVCLEHVKENLYALSTCQRVRL